MGVRVVDACGGSWPQWLPACDGGGGDGWLCGLGVVVCSLTASGPITTVTWLLCAGNYFGEKGAEHITSVLRENTTITQIDLHCEGDM